MSEANLHTYARIRSRPLRLLRSHLPRKSLICKGGFIHLPSPSCYHGFMPILPNPKHEKFAQLIVRGKSQFEAYMMAGYSPSGARGNASRLIANDIISGRVKELQIAQLEKTQENLCENLWEINNLIAVSYTHLDVYKRQQHLSMLCGRV